MEVMFLCSKDGNRLSLTKGKYSLYYACPKKNTKSKCNSRISLKEAETIKNEILTMYVNRQIREGTTYLIENRECTVGPISYESFIQVYI